MPLLVSIGKTNNTALSLWRHCDIGVNGHSKRIRYRAVNDCLGNHSVCAND